MTSRYEPKPEWLKVRAPGGDTYHELKRTFRELDLATVCEEARCPNVGECWREGTATVMLLGDVCTRGCRFCAVTTGDPRGAVDSREPEHTARAIARLDLQYVVLTMVDRDDLLDGGAEHVARTVRALHGLRPDILVETLTGDFGGHLSNVDAVVDGGPDVFAHNIEVVRRLQRPIRDVRSSYEQSLAVLRRAKERIARAAGEARASGGGASAGGDTAGEGGARRGLRLTKSSIMVGIGETDDEVLEAMADLREAGVDVVTLGQYLRPSPKHAPVDRYVHPDIFAAFARAGDAMGFLYTASGPLVRSSYKAAEAFLRGVLGARPDGGADPYGHVDAVLLDRLAAARREAARVAGELGTEGAALRDHAPAERLVPAESLVRRPAAG